MGSPKVDVNGPVTMKKKRKRKKENKAEEVEPGMNGEERNVPKTEKKANGDDECRENRPTAKPVKGRKGKLIQVRNCGGGKTTAAAFIEDINEPSNYFESTPGRMIVKGNTKPSGGEDAIDNVNDSSGDPVGIKKKRLGSKRRKATLNKRERRKRESKKKMNEGSKKKKKKKKKKGGKKKKKKKKKKK